MKKTTKVYREQFEPVFDYINTHLAEHLTVDKLSKVANFSKYHFHRQFSEYFGISLFKYIQLLRLKRASYQLAFRSHYRVIDVAISAGFESSESFSRAFKKTFGQTPKEFRKEPQWQVWHGKYQILSKEIFQNMNAEKNTNKVKIVEFKETKIAVLEHRGSPELIGNSARKFIAWRKENQLSPQVSQTYNILYNEADEYKIDICCSIASEVKKNEYGVITKVIPAGKCAVLRHFGSDENLKESFNYLYGQWLPNSGEELRDFPCFMHRVNFFPDVAEHETIIDIYLPLK